MPDVLTSSLFTPLDVGEIGQLSHRVVLAPLTRNRAIEPGLVPSPLAVQYYRQRASSGGLLISEATNISPEALAYPSTPGIWTTAQVQGWKQVTEAVHEKGGFIVCQLWHTGRVAHPSYGNHPANQETSAIYRPCVSASAVPITNRKGIPGKTLTYDGVKPFSTPRELSRMDIRRIRCDYARAAENAKKAGFDGIELHGGHGYLIDQFLNNGVNRRTDEYGGSVENRCRLLKEVVEALREIWPAGRIAVRLSPHEAPKGGNTYYGCKDSAPDDVYSEAFSVLSTFDLAYVLVTEPRWIGRHDDNHETDPGFQMPLINLQKFRALYKGLMIGAGGFTPTTSFEASVTPNGYDALAFGRWFISNPDLPRRLKAWHDYEASGRVLEPPPPPLNRYNRETFYLAGAASGYIDYPSMEFEGFQRRGAGANYSPDFDGMITGKYSLVEQSQIGTSLQDLPKTSKL